MNEIQGIEINESNKELETLLSAWVQAIKRYTSANEFDNPWWYNERASLSILAGAAWSLNKWLALEEFSTLKRYHTLEPGVDSGSLRHGRCDLFVQSPSSSFAIEAKQTVQSIGARSNGSTYVARAMRRAWDDSGVLSKWEAVHRFAVTFIVPYIPTNEVLNNSGSEAKVCPCKVSDSINNWLIKQSGFLGASMKKTDFAYIFPKLGNKNYSLNGRYFPGIVMVFEKRLRSNRLQSIA